MLTSQQSTVLELDDVAVALLLLDCAHRSVQRRIATGDLDIDTTCVVTFRQHIFQLDSLAACQERRQAERQELQAALAAGDPAAILDEAGDVFYQCVKVSAHHQPPALTDALRQLAEETHLPPHLIALAAVTKMVRRAATQHKDHDADLTIAQALVQSAVLADH